MGRIGIRILLISNETDMGVTTQSFNSTISVPTEPDRRSNNFNPTLAAIVSGMVFSFFLVGFATGYFRRWIIGPEEIEGTGEGFYRRRNFAPRPRSRQPVKPGRGLDPEIVNALPLVQYADLPADQLQAGKYFDCPVCLAVFDPTDSLRLLPLCAHAFHSDCIDEWFASHTTCPLCRACLAHQDMKEPSTEVRDPAGDAGEPGGTQGPPDVDIVEVVIGDVTGGASATSEFPQELPTVGARTAISAREEQQEPKEQVCSRAVIFSNARGSSFLPAIRMASSPANPGLTPIRRSSSVGTGLQFRHAGYVVDSEGIQHKRNFQMHSIAMDDQNATQAQSTEFPTISRVVSLGDHWASGTSSLAFGVISNNEVRQGTEHIRSSRWSFPNLIQIVPL